MLLCLHEESAVAIAHGYAKVTGKAMAAAVHSNVGLMHAHHGDLQRLVRPHADGHPRRDRAGRCRQAAAVDRLDPHRARSGRAGARLHQMGRPAGLAGGRARSRLARQLDRQYRAARADLRQSRCRDAGEQARRAGGADRRQAVHAAGRKRRARRSHQGRRRITAGRQSIRSFSPAASRAMSTPGTRASRSPSGSMRASSPI